MRLLSGHALRVAPLRARKLFAIATNAQYRAAFRAGVAPAIEHAGVPFRDDVRTVIDAGASRGQFAVFALRRWPSATLHCFEPLPGPRAALQEVARRLAPERLHVHPVALGTESRRVAMHVSAADDSSSLLPVGARQVEEFPGTHEVRTEDVQVERLDRVLGAGDAAAPVLLKIDVQGGELDVLRGAETLLGGVDSVFVECSFVELYGGQPLADELVTFLAPRGLRLRGVFGIVRDARGGCVQGDFLFERVSPDG